MTSDRSSPPGVAFVLLVGAIVLLAGIVDGASAQGLSGRVDAQTKPGVTRGTTIVYAEPLDGTAPSRAVTIRLEQKDKTFRPTVLAVPVGSTVEFPNTDVIFHNVFSLSRPQPFDLGLYRGGESKSRTFSQPGTYWVFCNIHPQMAAFLAVVPTPWVTIADADGGFRLELPQGKYRLSALSDRAQPVTAEVVVAATPAAPVLRIDETTWVSVSHKNKFNQEYPASAYETPRRR